MKPTNTRRDDENPTELLVLGRIALGVNGVDLAKLLNVSSKTTWRWLNKVTTVGSDALGDLAVLVHPRDPALAARMHAYATKDLATIGLTPPPLPAPPPTPAPPPPPPAPAPAPAPPGRVEVVLYAACEAMDAAPSIVKPTVLAAFRKARELGLTIEDVERELSPPPKTEVKKK